MNIELRLCTYPSEQRCEDCKDTECLHAGTKPIGTYEPLKESAEDD